MDAVRGVLLLRVALTPALSQRERGNGSAGRYWLGGSELGEYSRVGGWVSTVSGAVRRGNLFGAAVLGWWARG